MSRTTAAYHQTLYAGLYLIGLEAERELRRLRLLAASAGARRLVDDRARDDGADEHAAAVARLLDSCPGSRLS